MSFFEQKKTYREWKHQEHKWELIIYSIVLALIFLYYWGKIGLWYALKTTFPYALGLLLCLFLFRWMLKRNKY